MLWEGFSSHGKARRIPTLKDRHKEIGRDLLAKMCRDPISIRVTYER
jgi:hypothetical protein